MDEGKRQPFFNSSGGKGKDDYFFNLQAAEERKGGRGKKG